MFIKFKDCGHSEFFPPARSAHTRSMRGICAKCKRQNRLAAALVTVEARRRLIVIIETEEEKEQRIHRLGNDELRPSRKVRG
jgi:hypothetical protein